MTNEPKRSVEAPKSTYQGAPVVFSNVLLAEDEEVQWIWTHASEGSYVSGYKIIEKEPSKWPGHSCRPIDKRQRS